MYVNQPPLSIKQIVKLLYSLRAVHLIVQKTHFKQRFSSIQASQRMHKRTAGLIIVLLSSKSKRDLIVRSCYSCQALRHK